MARVRRSFRPIRGSLKLMLMENAHTTELRADRRFKAANILDQAPASTV